MLFGELQRELDLLKQQSLYRSLRRIEAMRGGQVKIGGQWLISLASNNYLGLTEHPRVMEAAKEAIDRYGAGSGSARLIAGNLTPHEQLEQELARFKLAQDSLLFSTGYMASLGIVTALVGPEDLVIGDRLNHASLIDACRLSGAAFRVYPHKDAERLEESLASRRKKYRRTLIITEGLFSMDGDIAPLPQIAQIARRHDAWLLIDDAHATGVLGKTGRGSLEHFNLPTDNILQMGTLSKGLGSLGGYLAGPKAVVEHLRNFSRPFIFTTGLAPSCAAAALEALKVVQEQPALRERLWANTRRWTQGLKKIRCELVAEESPIVPVVTGGNGKTMQFAKALFEEGIYAPGIRPPTVPEGSGRIRTSLTALHTDEQLDLGLQAFQKVWQRQMAGAAS